MRIRSIRPEFWSSEDVAAMDWHTRLVYIGLWSYVDDNGVGRDVERLIVTELFPLDEDLSESSLRVHGALKHLETHGQITRYQADGKPYLFVNAFDEHQKVNRPSRSRYPLPTRVNAGAHDTLTEPSVSPHATPPTGEGEKGRRGEGEKKTSSSLARKSATKTTRLAADWMPSPDTVEAMGAENPHVNQERELAKFHDYWAAQPDSRGKKADWEATYRNWIRNAADKTPRGGSSEVVSRKQRENQSLFERTAKRWGLIDQNTSTGNALLAIEGNVL